MPATRAARTKKSATVGTAPPSSLRRNPTRGQTSSNIQPPQQQSTPKQTASGRKQLPRATNEVDEEESDESEGDKGVEERDDGDSTSTSASPVVISKGSASKSATAKGKETAKVQEEVVESESGSDSDEEVVNLLTPAKALVNRTPKLKAAAASTSKAIAADVIAEEADDNDYDQLDEEVDELESESERGGSDSPKPELVRTKPLPPRKKQLRRDESDSSSEEEGVVLTTFSRKRNGKRGPDRVWVYGEFYTEEERVQVIEQLEDGGAEIVPEIEEAHYAVFPSLGRAIYLNPDFVECHQHGVPTLHACWVQESVTLSEREGAREGGKIRSYPPLDFIIKAAFKERKPREPFSEEDKSILAHALRDLKKNRIHGVDTKKALFKWLEKKHPSHTASSWENHFKKNMPEIDGIRSKIRHEARAQRGAANQQQEPERRATKKRSRGAQEQVAESSESEATGSRSKRASTGSRRSESERRGEQGAVATGSRRQVEIEEGGSSAAEETPSNLKKGTQSGRNEERVSDSESQEEILPSLSPKSEKYIQDLSQVYGLLVTKLEQIWYYTSYNTELFEPILRVMTKPIEEHTKADKELLKKRWNAEQDEIIEKYTQKVAAQKLGGRSKKDIETRVGFLESLQAS